MGETVGSGNALTYTEVHAAIIGLVVGVLAGYALLLGYDLLAAGVSATFVSIALGVRTQEELPVAQTTVRREPWYALGAFLVGALVAWLL